MYFVHVIFWKIKLLLLQQGTRISRDHFVYAPHQWEMTLHCNVVSHWLGTQNVPWISAGAVMTKFGTWLVGSLRRSDAIWHWHHGTLSTLVLVMVCHLFSTKPLPIAITSSTRHLKLSEILNQNTIMLSQENTFENVVCKMSSILSKLHWVKSVSYTCCRSPFWTHTKIYFKPRFQEQVVMCSITAVFMCHWIEWRSNKCMRKMGLFWDWAHIVGSILYSPDVIKCWMYTKFWGS